MDSKRKDESKPRAKPKLKRKAKTQPTRIDPIAYRQTDAGNAELFAGLYGDRLRFNRRSKRWLVWRGHWWAEDKKGRVMQFAKGAARFRLRNAPNISDKERRENEVRWAMKSESRQKLEAALALATSEPDLADLGTNWDASPWLLGTKNGIVTGVTGKRAVHLMDTAEREKVPKIHDMWIDLGVSSKKEAEQLVRVGDTATYDHEFEMLTGSVGTARAFDNKTGAYIAGETLRRLAEVSDLAAKVVAVGTTQEEIGTRGAMTSTHAIAPDYGIAIDVGHATDFPDANNKRFGAFKMGGGVLITRGPQLNPLVTEALIDVAEANNIPYQLEAERGIISNDSRSIQVAGPGVATGTIGLALRYMHTPSEMVDLEDVEACVQLLVAWIKTLKSGDRAIV